MAPPMEPHGYCPGCPLLPPPPPTPSSGTSFPIIAISILGMLTTAILLLSYYVFVIKCCLNWRRTDVIRRLSRSRRGWHIADDDPLSSVLTSTINNDRGLAESAIQAIPTFRFRMRRGDQNSFHECAVCLSEFHDEERIRLLPNCQHVFHIDCIDTWLQTHTNCPLCRAEITSTTVMHPNLDPDESLVIEVREDGSDHQTGPRIEPSSNANPTSSNTVGGNKKKKLQKVSSMGEECIDVRAKDDQFAVQQPMRRSLSMDSSNDRQLYMAVQDILRQNPLFREARNGGEGPSTGSGRTRRSFFSFGHGRSSTSAVLPIQNEL